MVKYLALIFLTSVNIYFILYQNTAFILSFILFIEKSGQVVDQYSLDKYVFHPY